MKRFNTMYNIGKVKYVINYHNGIDKHNDGSDFFGIYTFKNKKKFEAKIKKLKIEGYTQTN
jgi:hypothetical protein